MDFIAYFCIFYGLHWWAVWSSNLKLTIFFAWEYTYTKIRSREFGLFKIVSAVHAHNTAEPLIVVNIFVLYWSIVTEISENKHFGQTAQDN